VEIKTLLVEFHRIICDLSLTFQGILSVVTILLP